MTFVYASRTGNVESIIHRLGNEDTLSIQTGNETVKGAYVLFTYTDGYGDVPAEVDTFLSNNASNLRGVIASGDLGYGEAYCLAGDKIAELYGVDCLYKVENDGSDEDIIKMQAILNTL